jgi:uncharacterized protein (TIGR03435 family)
MKTIGSFVWKKRLFGAATTVLLVAPLLFGQDDPTQRSAAAVASSDRSFVAPTAGKVEFEVASVRLSQPGTPPRGVEALTPFDYPSPQSGLFSANAPLLGYIIFAYKVLDFSQLPALMKELPAWAQTDSFDIEARSEGTPTRDQLRRMVRTLLEQRFKLAIHTETRQLPVYALVLDKPGHPGPQLKPHPENAPCTTNSPDTIAPSSSGAPPPSYCGVQIWPVDGRFHLRMTGLAMDQIASFLGGGAGFLGGRANRPVIDRTGLQGRFDLEMEFVKENNGPDTQPDAQGPTFTGALKDKLGLKLESTTGPVEILVVDHVERPSAN